MKPSSEGLRPKDVVECPHLHCLLTAEACARRQAARWPGQRRADDERDGPGAPLFEHCGSGTCDQGMAVRAALPLGFVPAPRGLRADIREQWAAYRRWWRTRLQEVPDIDHPPGREGTARGEGHADPDADPETIEREEAP